MVCGAERASISDLNKKLPPNSVYMGTSRGPVEIQEAGETRSGLKVEANNAALARF